MRDQGERKTLQCPSITIRTSLCIDCSSRTPALASRIFPCRADNAKVVSGAPFVPLGPTTMSDKSASSAAQPLLPVELGAGKIRFAQGMKAGRWVFATGLMAQDFVNGIAGDVLAPRAPH